MVDQGTISLNWVSICRIRENAYVKIYKRKREPVRITPEEETEEKVQERLQAKREEEINAVIGDIHAKL